MTSFWKSINDSALSPTEETWTAGTHSSWKTCFLPRPLLPLIHLPQTVNRYICTCVPSWKFQFFTIHHRFQQLFFCLRDFTLFRLGSYLLTRRISILVYGTQAAETTHLALFSFLNCKYPTKNVQDGLSIHFAQGLFFHHSFIKARRPLITLKVCMCQLY